MNAFRILFLVIVLAGSVALALARVTPSVVENQSDQALFSSATLESVLVAEMERTAVTRRTGDTRLLAADANLRAALADTTGEAPSPTAMFRQARGSVLSTPGVTYDASLLAGSDGQAIDSTITANGLDTPTLLLSARVELAIAEGRPVHTYFEAGGLLFGSVASPVTNDAGQTTGVVVLAEEYDDSMAASMRSGTDANTVFFVGHTVVASNVGDEELRTKVAEVINRTSDSTVGSPGRLLARTRVELDDRTVFIAPCRLAEPGIDTADSESVVGVAVVASGPLVPSNLPAVLARFHAFDDGTGPVWAVIGVGLVFFFLALTLLERALAIPVNDISRRIRDNATDNDPRALPDGKYPVWVREVATAYNTFLDAYRTQTPGARSKRAESQSSAHLFMVDNSGGSRPIALPPQEAIEPTQLMPNTAASGSSTAVFDRVDEVPTDFADEAPGLLQLSTAQHILPEEVVSGQLDTLEISGESSPLNELPLADAQSSADAAEEPQFETASASDDPSAAPVEATGDENEFSLLDISDLSEETPKTPGADSPGAEDTSASDDTPEPSAMADEPALEESTLDESSVVELTADESSVVDSTLDDSTLDDSTLDDSTLDDSTLDDSTLDDSTLDDSTLDDSTLDDSTLDDSTLDDSTLDDSTLDDSTAPPAEAPDAFAALPEPQAKPTVPGVGGIGSDPEWAELLDDVESAISGSHLAIAGSAQQTRATGADQAAPSSAGDDETTSAASGTDEPPEAVSDEETSGTPEQVAAGADAPEPEQVTAEEDAPEPEQVVGAPAPAVEPEPSSGPADPPELVEASASAPEVEEVAAVEPQGAAAPDTEPATADVESANESVDEEDTTPSAEHAAVEAAPAPADEPTPLPAVTPPADVAPEPAPAVPAAAQSHATTMGEKLNVEEAESLASGFQRLRGGSTPSNVAAVADATAGASSSGIDGLFDAIAPHDSASELEAEGETADQIPFQDPQASATKPRVSMDELNRRAQGAQTARGEQDSLLAAAEARLRSLRPSSAPSHADLATGEHQGLFEEFVRAKNSCGEDASRLTYQRFVAKLDRNRVALMARYNCSDVRFEVSTRDGKVTLKATPIR